MVSYPAMKDLPGRISRLFLIFGPGKDGLTPPHYIESVPNVDTLWTDLLKKGICVPFWHKTGANTISVYNVTDFVDRHYIIDFLSHYFFKFFFVAEIILDSPLFPCLFLPVYMNFCRRGAIGFLPEFQENIFIGLS
jgi:hypothetical protein